MADTPNFADLQRVARDEVLARNGNLTPEVVEREGTDANILIACDAAVGEEVIGQIQRVEAGLFLDSSTGAALDKLVFDRYGLLRKPAAPAIGAALFQTATLSAVTFAIPVNTTLQSDSGNQYITTAEVNYPAGATSPVSVPIRSVLAGLGQAASVGSINAIISDIPGAPTDLGVTNGEATAGSDDQEPDASFRDRARKFFLTARRGTRLAIEQGALAVAGVRTATAFEIIDSSGRPARIVQLVVSDAFTDVLASYTASPPPSYAIQSQQLAATIFQQLDDVRAAGIYVDVIVAQVVLQPIVLRLAYQAGVDTEQVSASARAAAVSYVNSLAPGVALIYNDLRAAVQATPGLSVTGNEIASPSGDVLPNPLQVIRTSLAIVARA